MKTETLYCDYCKKKTTDEGIKKERLNGITIELGYSIGGWGYRKDFIPKHTAEICDDCFKEVQNKISSLSDSIYDLKRGTIKKITS